MTSLRGLTVGVALFVSLTGCAVTTPPLTDEQRLARVSADIENLFANQEAVSRPITLAEAMARALKYNMDHRVKLMEFAVANRHVEVARMDLLPDLVLSAGYSDRSNEAGATSVSLLTGQISLEPSTSQERQRDLADAVFYWNLLDFGVGYVAAKQRYDEMHIAEERRRKVVQNIIHDVIEAYWRAWSAQNLMGRMEALIEETDAVIQDSKRLVELGSQPKEQALEYQQALMEIRTQLWEMRERMALSRTRLAALINLRPGTEYTLDAPEAEELPPLLQKTLEGLEQEALLNRPELREEDYRLRVSQGDVKKAMLRMFPGLEITAGGHYDSNLFLFNQSWADGLVQVSWNIFNVLRGMEGKKFREAQVTLADTRRMALSMAVMTQVRLAAQRYDLARARYKSLRELSEVNHALLELAQGSTSTTTKFERIRAQAVSVASTMRSNLAYAEVQAAFSRVLNSIGVDPLPEEVASHELDLLAEAIDDHWGQITSQRLDGEQIAVLHSDQQITGNSAETAFPRPHQESQAQATVQSEIATAVQSGMPQDEAAQQLSALEVNTARRTPVVVTRPASSAEKLKTQPLSSPPELRPRSERVGEAGSVEPSDVAAPHSVPWLSQAQPLVLQQGPIATKETDKAKTRTPPLSTVDIHNARRTPIAVTRQSTGKEQSTTQSTSSALAVSTARRAPMIAVGKRTFGGAGSAQRSLSGIAGGETVMTTALKPVPVKSVAARRKPVAVSDKSAFAEDGSARPVQLDKTPGVKPTAHTEKTLSAAVPWLSQGHPVAPREPVATKESNVDKPETTPPLSAADHHGAKRTPIVVRRQSTGEGRSTEQTSSSPLEVNTAKRTPVGATREPASAGKITAQPLSLAPQDRVVKKMPVVGSVSTPQRVPWE